MNKKLITFLIVLFCIFFAFVFFREPNQKTNKNESVNINTDIDLLWNNTIYEMLQDPLWKERDAYDAGHFLMVPMHSAFALNDPIKINHFYDFFDNFVNNYKEDDFESLDQLTKQHFLYLVSEYMVLSNEHQKEIPEKLENILIGFTKEFWNDPAWQWKVCLAPEFQSMEERISWKLENKEVPRSFCRAITDHELFMFAIGADLKTVLGHKSPQFVNEILEKSYEVFQEEVVFLSENSERWLFQPGVWTDHSHYRYAGHEKLVSNLEEEQVFEIAWDSSHSHRFPLWLISLERGFLAQDELEKADYFKKLQRGLTDQFINEVLVFPNEEFDNYRTTNYMDGNNGLYRYEYKTVGENLGYGPYDLSGTILLGWWSFLSDKSISRVYCDITSSYPFSNKEIETYLGPDTTRDRHPFIKGENKYNNGLTKLINLLSCQFSDNLEK
jgi:hypothetical protein